MTGAIGTYCLSAFLFCILPRLTNTFANKLKFRTILPMAYSSMHWMDGWSFCAYDNDNSYKVACHCIPSLISSMQLIIFPKEGNCVPGHFLLIPSSNHFFITFCSRYMDRSTTMSIHYLSMLNFVHFISIVMRCHTNTHFKEIVMQKHFTWLCISSVR